MHELPADRVGLKSLSAAERSGCHLSLFGRPPSAAGPLSQPPPHRAEPRRTGADAARTSSSSVAAATPSVRAVCPGRRPGATPPLAHAWRAGAMCPGRRPGATLPPPSPPPPPMHGRLVPCSVSVLGFSQRAWIWANTGPRPPYCRADGAGHRPPGLADSVRSRCRPLIRQCRSLISCGKSGLYQHLVFYIST